MSTSPSNPTPPAGPGRLNLAAQLASLLDIKGRAKRAAAAKTAGSYGSSVSPLTAERREDNYRRQNGTDRLTARQQRRADHKAERARRTRA
ncbi:hypothetical protein [Micromonospora sp. NPDC005324]|uniref:hypothetical protein n=1 Tax=Micromonospora sp. NPDC005324 TaxID=3157033 RepID=UPI00339FF56D